MACGSQASDGANSDSKRIVSLKVTLYKDGTQVGDLEVVSSVEVGRRDRTDQVASIPSKCVLSDGLERWVIADLDSPRVPRKACTLQWLEKDRVRVENVHATNRELWVHCKGEKVQVLPGKSIERPVPFALVLPDGYRMEMASASATLSEVLDETVSNHGLEERVNSLLGYSSGSSFFSGESSGVTVGPGMIGGGSEALGSVSGMVSIGGASAGMTMFGGGEQDATMLSVLMGVISALQEPVDLANSRRYFLEIARGIMRKLKMERVEIVFWRDGDWVFDPAYRFIRKGSRGEQPMPSRKLLDRVRMSHQLAIHPSEHDEPPSESQMEVQLAIASPILDPSQSPSELVGVLYADRPSGSMMDMIGRDEQHFIALLTAMTAMRLGGLKKQKELTTYQQFFSPKVVESLVDKGEAFLDGRDTEVSVLFCDLRGFSKATDRMEANEAMRWLSDTLSELSQAVLDADGVLVDYVGDELFAMWGAPEILPSHAFSAATTALTMLALRKKLNERYADRAGFGIDFGIGLCTGMARVGNTGSKQKFKYGPMGRTVNLGSRIQGLTKQWKVSALMSKSTAECLPGDMPKRRLCTASVVGLDGTVDLYQLMSEEEADEELIRRYSEGLALYEGGKNFRETARVFGELVQKYPTDGPSLIMLVRAVNELVNPAEVFSPVWKAATK